MFVFAGCTSSQQFLVREPKSLPVEEPKPEPPLLPQTLFTTIGEIRKLPLLFDEQMVRLKGTVTGVQLSPQADKPSTVFELIEDGGAVLRVKTAERVKVDDGSTVTIEGRVSVEDPTASAPTYVGITEARIVATEPQKKEPAPRAQPRAQPAMLEELLRAEDLLPEVPLPAPPPVQENEAEGLLPEVPLPDQAPPPEPNKDRVF